MHAHELDAVLDWAADEGWNPGLHDAACFHATDPGGFLLGMAGGEAVASIFAVAYGAGFGFIGGYIVKPACRGRGYGMALWNAATARLAGRNVGLDGVLARQADYARSGFRLAHRNIRFEGRGGGGPAAAADAGQVVPLTTLPFGDIARYDRSFFADERSAFLRCWIAQPHSVALGIVGPQGLAGYAVLRPCREGYKIGPLFADTPAGAEALFASLRGRVAPGAPVFLDVPEPNAEAMALAARHRMRPCFETARMYTGPEPELCLARQYGITTFELG
ncbi:GNAT family N-acetyltransferase [Pseudoduganella sp. LjRoot289]|uniref:GNAT family N-acetyltransferase n=1 Tax=Pseudoduganella sp. LjRoot289 TaxID=3342314 RepID=UPI003ECC6B62